jgi:putative Mg2+ transporter-C (MgtC) family protein
MTTDFIIRIFIAAILGGAIGLEREYRAKEAGFRTHFLVGLGAALFMIMSQWGYDDVLNHLGSSASVDPSRIASQVVTGIGFIGAGTIIFQRHVVRGLTTAAGLWVTAAIGLTCGSGMYLLAATATILVLLCLEVMNLILHRFGAKNILVTFISPNREGVQQVLRTLKADGIAISSCEMKDRHEACEVTLELQVKRDKYEAQLIALMDKLQGMSIERIE